MENMTTTPGDVPPPFVQPRAEIPMPPPPAAAAPAASQELPYPMAKRLREQGISDALIAAELMRTGLSESDAQFVIGSLGGGRFSRPLPPLSGDTGSASGEGLPISGVLMVALGLLITVGTYASAAPGGSYVITWGLILAGVVRIMRGR
jgi:hypothetical protein